MAQEGTSGKVQPRRDTEWGRVTFWRSGITRASYTIRKGGRGRGTFVNRVNSNVVVNASVESARSEVGFGVDSSVRMLA